MLSINVKFLLISLKAAIIFMGLWGTQSRADFFLLPKDVNYNVAQLCDGDDPKINGFKRDILLEGNSGQIGVLPAELGVACFKNKSFALGNENDTIIVVYPTNGGDDEINYVLLNFYVNRFIKRSINLKETSGLDFSKKPEPVENIGDILTAYPDGVEALTNEQFIQFIRKNNQSFLKLIQHNLSLPYSSNRFDNLACTNLSDGQILYEAKVDGLWGQNTRDAIRKALINCGNGDMITSDLISEIFLPQIFTISKRDTKNNSGSSKTITETDRIVLEVVTSNSDDDITDSVKQVEATAETEANQETANELEGSVLEDETTSVTDSQLEVLKDEIVRLKNERRTLIDSSVINVEERDEAVAERDRAKKLFDKQASRTIFEIWDGFPVEVWGELPGGNRRQLAIKNELTTSCRISPDKTLLATALDAYTSKDCFEYKFSIGQIDTKKEYTLRELPNGRNEIIVPLLPERIETIVSVQTTELGGLSPQSIANCGIKMTFLREGQTEISLDPMKDPSGLYPNVSKDNQSVWLSDQNTIKNQAINYAGLNVRLETTENENQKCALEKPIEMSIVEDKYADNGKPQAVIDRAGNLKLYDLPLTLVKGTTLVVFFDANVGYQKQDWYAFNRSLNDKEIQKRQKVYFSGFLEGLQEYLANQTNIESIIVYKSIGHNDDPQTAQEFKVIIEEQTIQDPKVRDLAIEALNTSKNDLVSGQQGSFSNKLKMIKNLQTKNKPVKFVSFGPSGYKKDQACNTNRIMFDSEFLILDIWPTIILDGLNDKGAISAKLGALAYQCNSSPNILGFRISSTTSNSKEISPFVVKYLETFLGE